MIAHLLEIIPVLLFVVTFYVKGMHAATIAIVSASALCTAIAFLFRLKVPKLFWLVNSIIILFGTFSVLLKDPSYIKLKPTIVYLVSASAVLISAIFNKPILRKGLSQVMDISDIKVWRRNSYLVSMFFVLCAILNEYVRKNYDDAVWIKFKLFGFTAITFTFFALFLLINKKYLKSLK